MSIPIYKMTHGMIGEAMCCYTEGSYKDADIALTKYEAEIRADARSKTIDKIEDIVDEINNQGLHCIDDYCDDDNHDCAECMAKAILRMLEQMKGEQDDKAT